MASGEMRCTCGHAKGVHLRGRGACETVYGDEHTFCDCEKFQPAAVPESAIEPEPQRETQCKCGALVVQQADGTGLHYGAWFSGECRYSFEPASSSAIEVAPQCQCGHDEGDHWGREEDCGDVGCSCQQYRPSVAPGEAQREEQMERFDGKVHVPDFASTGTIYNVPAVPSEVAPSEPLEDALREMKERAEKYSEMERVARNNGDNCSMDHASGSKHAYFQSIRLVRAALRGKVMADGIRVAPSSEPSIPADPWKAAFAEWWHSSGFRKSFSVEEVFKAGWDAAPIERLGRAEDRIAELAKVADIFQAKAEDYRERERVARYGDENGEPGNCSVMDHCGGRAGAYFMAARLVRAALAAPSRGQAEGEAEMSEWISVKERLPKNSRAVLVWCPGRFNKYTAYWANGDWIHFCGSSSFVQEEITHWMPTPEPPL